MLAKSAAHPLSSSLCLPAYLSHGDGDVSADDVESRQHLVGHALALATMVTG